MLVRVEKFIQFEEKMAESKAIYEGCLEKVKTSKRGTKEIKKVKEKRSEEKKNPN